MKSLWLENNQLTLRDYSINLPPDEALIKVRMSGICATDVELVKGYYPFTGVLGHEFVGEVIELGEHIKDQTQWLGKRVVGEINVRCGVCRYCRRGLINHCENRSVLGISNRNGVHAEFTTLPLRNLVLVPDSLPDKLAVFTEPVAAACEILEKAHIKPSEKVLVVGAGKFGLLIAQVLRLIGIDLAVVAKHQSQFEILEKLNLPAIRAEEISKGDYDAVVEVTASPAGFELARFALRPEGKLILKSTYKGNMELNMSSVVVDELQIIGTRCGPFPPALRLLDMRVVDPMPLIEEVFPLADGLEAFNKAIQPGILKVLLKP